MTDRPFRQAAEGLVDAVGRMPREQAITTLEHVLEGMTRGVREGQELAVSLQALALVRTAMDQPDIYNLATLRERVESVIRALRSIAEASGLDPDRIGIPREWPKPEPERRGGYL